MLYTGKGDGGTTKLFNTPVGERLSKSANIFEALGTIDELNSFLGIVKVLCTQTGYAVNAQSFESIIHNVQENLFIIQAELAGSAMSITESTIHEVEGLITNIETNLPPIKTFFISGGTLLGAHFDTARTIARRAERRVVAVHEAGSQGQSLRKNKVSEQTLKYLNRLSSLFYALARYSNHLVGIDEKPPSY
ncbi:ATP:cob(I)alamin adenosyltransferase [Candidatus Nomurabacteria bacterium RIFCSPHIGHO2_02_FULL_38_15]|uniref:Corrinoid adenosyltransferase n=1 Tax=Candidatus Nomurabacteria bacterium RIFCSPHIGHO2_02_FULL_38_15 TaxID=1801752 RepID=A0A1F6VSP8_9BACT|nr:MAG: ATP:cob(I)alamin adenosyltransferase [Candidatus Nomurabacteria bacterium RIFCSPHIGHO2_02_FULL_38_15]